MVAGLTVWAVLVPESLAYASIAGVSPVVGLYAAPAALILYAALGSSRHLVVGPMSATAALSAATVGDLVSSSGDRFTQMAVALALATGAAALIAGLLRLGFLASFISEPVIKGFIVGLALTIIIGQVPDLLGISKGSGDFFEKLWHVVSHLGDIDALTCAVGLVSLAAVVALKRLVPALPGSLLVVLVAIAAVALFNLDDHGLDIVGTIPAGLPPVGWPDVSAHDFGSLAPGAIGVMLVGFAEGLGAAKTYATRHHYDIDVNRELLGLGGANLGAGLCSGMVVNGSLSKTAVNGSAGARSQLSGVVVAILTVVTLLLFTGLFEKLPQATLAAVVIAAVVELVDFPAIAALYRVRIAARPDFVASVAALAGVLIFDTLPGLFIGIGVSLLLLVYRASRPHVAMLGKIPGTSEQYGDAARHPESIAPEGIAVLRVDGGLFFANADVVRARLRAAGRDDVRAVVLDAEASPFIDVTAARMIAEVAEELERNGSELVVAHALGEARGVLRHGGPKLYPSVQAAVDALSGVPA